MCVQRSSSNLLLHGDIMKVTNAFHAYMAAGLPDPHGALDSRHRLPLTAIHRFL